MAETKKDALAAFDVFVETWDVKYGTPVAMIFKLAEAAEKSWRRLDGSMVQQF
jgi:hypothetical protein